MTESGSVLVQGTAVSKIYHHAGERVAIQDASFSISARDSIAVIGPSGSGKSTLLQIVAGLDQPTSGAMSWPGLGPSQHLRPAKIGLVPQSPSLIPSLSVVENVMLPLSLFGRSQGAEDAAIACLAMLDLHALLAKLPEELSGGQAQRVAIARALVTQPRLIVADEPTGQLDHATAARVLACLSEWRVRTGAAILIATHDPEVAAAMSVTWRMHMGFIAHQGARD